MRVLPVTPEVSVCLLINDSVRWVQRCYKVLRIQVNITWPTQASLPNSPGNKTGGWMRNVIIPGRHREIPNILIVLFSHQSLLLWPYSSDLTWLFELCHWIPLFFIFPFLPPILESNLIYSRSVCASKTSLVYMPLHLYFALAFLILPFINLFLPLSHYTSLSSFHFLLLSSQSTPSLEPFFLFHLQMRCWLLLSFSYSFSHCPISLALTDKDGDFKDFN